MELLAWGASKARRHMLEEARSARFTCDGCQRILFVGDSFTAGELAESKLGYPHYVPDALTRLGVHPPAQTVSVALAGTPTSVHRSQVQAFFEESGQVPDYVMIISGANNRDALASRRAFVASEPGRSAPPGVRRFHGAHQSLGLIGKILGRWIAVAGGTEVTPLFAPYEEFFQTDPSYLAWVATQQRSELSALVHEVGAFGSAPLLGTYHSEVNNGAARAVAEAEGVPLFEFEEEGGPRTWQADGLLHEDGWHLNDAGTRVLADRWAARFVEITGGQ